MMEGNKCTFSNGDFVVVRSCDDDSSCILKINNSDQKIGKSRVQLKDLIGQSHGSVFEINNKRLVMVSHNEGGIEPSYTEGDGSEGEVGDFMSASKGDNSLYVDTNTAQKLKDVDILKLKESGVSGGDIIKSLIENSETFAVKTDFAQEKWIKRKEKKYRRTYRMVKSSPANLCDASFAKNKEKICGMRIDSFAQLLSHGNIYSGCRTLIIESMVGLIVGSAAYRMRGDGQILAVYGGQQPHFDMMHQFNLDEETCSVVKSVASIELGPAAIDVCAKGLLPRTEKTVGMKTADDAANKVADEDGTLAGVLGKRSAAAVDGGKEHRNRKGERLSSWRNANRSEEDAPRIRQLLREGSDSLIIASKFLPLPILKNALYLLTPSSPFVIYHEYMEPLLECYLYLQESGLAIRLVLADTWMREFQTLPGRFRPAMFMPTSGGYVLTGIYVGMVPCKYLPDDK